MDTLKSIVIALVGDWNIKIFTPNWVMKELFDLPEEGSEILVRFNAELQPVFEHQNVLLIPTEKFVEIKLARIGDDEIQLANVIAVKLITALPFTPKLAVGFNYRLERECDIKDLKIEGIGEGFDATEVKFTREDENYKINIIINCNQANQVLYNFHYKDFTQIKEDDIQEHLQYLQHM